MTQIVPNAYDRLYELGVTTDDYTKFFSGKQSEYIAATANATPTLPKQDSFETKTKAKFNIDTAKKIGFGALVGYLALAIAGKSKNPVKAFKNLKPFATKVIDKIKNHFKKPPTP